MLFPSYHVITVKTQVAKFDILSGLLYHLGSLGLEENEAQLKAYFAADVPLQILLQKIKNLDVEGNVEGITISLNSTPFLAQTFEPIELIKGTWIIPPPDMPMEGQAPEGKKLIIRPGAAFGTGRHESTQLAAEGIVFCRGAIHGALGSGVMNHAPTLLDVGTGSGILAIFASQLGFSPIDAVEIDGEARLNATENFELNGCQSIRLFDDLSKVSDKYDVIVANILAPTIIHLKPQIESRLNKGGKMIFSGIVKSEGVEIEKQFSHHTLLKRFQKNEWVGTCYEN